MTRITASLVTEHQLSEEEYRDILDILGREPSITELGIFSAMWSEHCSYKSSRKYLRTFPTTGPLVVQGPGENAGVVDLGDGLCAAFKMESHNHPSFIEPYQGAATGVGGILRDVFTMGARPVASLNSLRFGDLDAPRMRHLVDGVVRGIAGYGNCIGIPTLGGETTFHKAYNGNILVNVFNVGLVKKDRIFKGTAAGPGNAVVYVGSKTGRDGIHGATMASAEFGEGGASSKRPNVQVGDPFTEKLLLEACLEIFRTDAVVGIQDMGAAGLTSSSFEMAGRGGAGMEIELSLVPTREPGMTPYEIMLSESQERMLLVTRPDRLAEVLAVFHKWELDAVEIGKVTDTGRMVLKHRGEVVADMPVAPLSDRAPVYDRPRAAPKKTSGPFRWMSEPEPTDFAQTLTRLLASPNIAEKRWIWNQYDHMVRSNTVERPGGDAAVIRLKATAWVDDSGAGQPGRASATQKGLALKTDVNPFFCALDPRRGAAIAVAECARSIAATGARPLAVTDCLNFGNPEKPEVMEQFALAVEGISEACRVLETPVVSGNVSFYNETGGQSILPTPTIGMVGLLEDVERHVSTAFRREGDLIALIGHTRDELGGSEFLRTVRNRDEGPCPALDLSAEKRLVDFLVAAAARSLLASAHDVSDGGIAVALCESAFREDRGARLALASGGIRPSSILFGESTGRVLLSFSRENTSPVEALARAHDVPLTLAGSVGGGSIRIDLDGTTVLDAPLDTLKARWATAFRQAVEMDPAVER
ncbi:MAG: phosphoribosylformylglycinamidine synthase subunit PurL [Thermoanaerobaculia bacterium]